MTHTTQTSHLYTQAFFTTRQQNARQSAQAIVPLVLQALGHPQSIIDLGCGTGSWLSVFSEAGVPTIVGVDGSYVEKTQLEISPAQFISHNLEHPFVLPERHQSRFDLAMSIEVAEHLPPNRAESFVQELTALSDVVLFSAAIPGQGGIGHINEQWPEYWAQFFAVQGYVAVDYFRPQLWRNPAVCWWYSQNLLLFIRPEKLDTDLSHLNPYVAEVPMALVHPNKFISLDSELDYLKRRNPFKRLLRWLNKK